MYARILSGVLAALALSAAVPAAAQQDRPNILIVIADDMGFGDIGAFGSEIATPNLDQLATDGMVFTNFHVGASCSPTRTMLISGVDNHLAGLGNMLEIMADNQFDKPGYEGHLNHSVVALPRLLKDSGYHTYMTGKWHLGHEADTIAYARGFEKSFMLGESGADNWVEQPYAPFYKRVHYYEDDKLVSLPTDGSYFSSNFYTERLIDYIDSNLDDGKPFLAWIGYQAVHYPHQAPKEFIDKYNGVYDAGFTKLREARFARQKEIGLVSPGISLDEAFLKTTYKPWQIPDWDALSDEEKAFNARRMQSYAGMLDNMDVNIGRLLGYLDEKGIADNTIVLFLSDNGADPNELPASPDFHAWYNEHYPLTYIEDYKGDYSQMGQKGSYADYGPGWAAASVTPGSYYKTFSTEGGLRVPLIVRYPGMVAPGSQVNTFAFVKDVMPTLLELAGVAKPEGTYDGRKVHTPDGKSMVEVLAGKADSVHGDADPVGYELAGSSAIFLGRFKLMQNLPPKGTGDWELYDIEADPSELVNLADEMPERVAAMKAAYEAYARENNLVPVPDGYNPLEQAVKNSSREGGGH